jgi:hypothetical protein
MTGCGGHDDEHVNVICEAAHSRIHSPAQLPAHIIAKLDALWADLAEHWELCPTCCYPVEGCPCVARESADKTFGPAVDRYIGWRDYSICRGGAK